MESLHSDKKERWCFEQQEPRAYAFPLSEPQREHRPCELAASQGAGSQRHLFPLTRRYHDIWPWPPLLRPATQRPVCNVGLCESWGFLWLEVNLGPENQEGSSAQSVKALCSKSCGEFKGIQRQFLFSLTSQFSWFFKKVVWFKLKSSCSAFPKRHWTSPQLKTY